MPELNVGYYQGTPLPFYLTIKTLDGDLVEQPPENPTIRIHYMEEESRVRKVVLDTTVMNEIEPGRYFYVWRIPKLEPTVLHHVMMRGILTEDLQVPATDDSYLNTSLFRNEDFVINVQVIEDPGIFLPEVAGQCYPEVIGREPKCRPKPYKRSSAVYDREEDIGLDDYAIEGVFRFGEFPNAVVDRRVVGRFNFQVGAGIRSGAGGWVPSEQPGGGSAQRQGNPATNTSYTRRKRYRY